MSRKNLILIHRGPEYEADFIEIADKVHALDGNIFVLPIAALKQARVPEAEWAYPTLTVALCQEIRLPIKRGPILRNQMIGKLEQAEILRAHGIATPPAEKFSFGMKLDPIVYGKHVILKPLDPGLTSVSSGIHVLRRERAMDLHPEEFAANHPILKNQYGYLVQKFISTGTYPTVFRVSTFLGSILYAYRTRSNVASPGPDASDTELANADFTQKDERTITFMLDDDLKEVALAVAEVFGDQPLLGVDIIRDDQSGRPYVLEINAGGNTWHFSSPMWEKERKRDPDILQTMKSQFSAFDVAAETLVKKVHALAA